MLNLENKLENLEDVVINHVDILLIAAIKIDKLFPTAQFIMEGFDKPLRLDISDKRDGLLVYVGLHLLSRQLTKFLGCSIYFQTIPPQVFLEIFMETHNYFALSKITQRTWIKHWLDNYQLKILFSRYFFVWNKIKWASSPYLFYT